VYSISLEFMLQGFVNINGKAVKAWSLLRQELCELIHACHSKAKLIGVGSSGFGAAGLQSDVASELLSALGSFGSADDPAPSGALAAAPRKDDKVRGEVLRFIRNLLILEGPRLHHHPRLKPRTDPLTSRRPACVLSRFRNGFTCFRLLWANTFWDGLGDPSYGKGGGGIAAEDLQKHHKCRVYRYASLRARRSCKTCSQIMVQHSWSS
jgi:hypothetical protein